MKFKIMKEKLKKREKKIRYDLEILLSEQENENVKLKKMK